MSPGTSSRASTCLRCQISLLRGTTITSVQPSRSRCRSYSAIPKHKPARRTRSPGELEHRSLFGKFHRGKKGGFRESSAKLGTERLGSPAEILLLRNAGIKRTEGVSSEKNDNEKSTSRKLKREQILAAFEDGNRAPKEQEVNALLEGLRPAMFAGEDLVYLPKEEYDQLFDTLFTGFTHPQLFRYASTIPPRPVAPAKSTNKRVVGRSQWRQGKSSMNARLVAIPGKSSLGPADDGDLLEGAAPQRAPKDKSATPKGRLVTRLLKNLWNVEVIEEIESAGELEIHFKEPWHLAILQSGNEKGLLRKISRQRNCSIDIDEQDDVVRITADKETAKYTADDIEKAIRNSQEANFDLTPFSKSLVDQGDLRSLQQEDLDHAANLTRTHLAFTSKNGVTIHALAAHDIEHAKRTLRGMLGLPQAPKSIILMDSPSSLEKAIIHASSTQNTLPYVNRGADIGRWTLPVARVKYGERSETTANAATVADETTAETAQSSKSQRSARHKVSELIRKSPYPILAWSERSKGKDSPSSGNWEQKIRQDAFAEFGHVLHPIEYRHNIPQFQNLIKTQKLERRVFSSTTPALAQALSYIAEKHSTEILSNNFLVLRLSPISNTVDFGRRTIPDIEMRWLLTKEKEAVFKGLRATLSSSTADFLLPSQSTDIRFTRRDTCLTQETIDNMDVTRFDEMVRKSLRSRDLLSTPPSLNIKIPQWFPLSKKTSQTTIKREMELGKETWAKFVPVGFEYRQQRLVNIGLHALSYIGVQGGTMGGSRGRLRLTYGSAGESPKPSYEDVAQRTATPDGVAEEGGQDEAAPPPSPVGQAEPYVDAVEDFVQCAFNLGDLINDASREYLPSQQASIRYVAQM